MLTELQTQTARAIVNIFETGSVPGDYSKVTLIGGDTGGLTYGRSQTTLTSGGLHLLADKYCTDASAVFAADLIPFLPALEERDRQLDHSVYFQNLLRASADDPAMRLAQDSFFDSRYWEPARTAGNRYAIETALGTSVVYDSFVHGSWGHIRRRTEKAIGKASDTGERTWIEEYVRQRLSWLGNHRRADLRATVYRMYAFLGLIETGEWALELPLVVRGQEISEETLSGTPPGVYDGPQPRSRDIGLTSPLTRGLDVRLTQLRLSRPLYALSEIPVADGIFGRATARAVREFRASKGLLDAEAVDSEVFDALGL